MQNASRETTFKRRHPNRRMFLFFFFLSNLFPAGEPTSILVLQKPQLSVSFCKAERRAASCAAAVILDRHVELQKLLFELLLMRRNTRIQPTRNDWQQNAAEAHFSCAFLCNSATLLLGYEWRRTFCLPCSSMSSSRRKKNSCLLSLSTQLFQSPAEIRRLDDDLEAWKTEMQSLMTKTPFFTCLFCPLQRSRAASAPTAWNASAPVQTS